MSPLAPAALALALVPLVACGPAPAPASEAAPTPTPAAAPKDPATPDKVRTLENPSGLIPMTQGPRPAPEPPLTQEEIDLLAADPATLSLEMRRKRGYAMRRKILQNPDSPAARQLEALRLATERGELKPQLPELVFRTSTAAKPATTPASPTPTPTP